MTVSTVKQVQQEVVNLSINECTSQNRCIVVLAHPDLNPIENIALCKQGGMQKLQTLKKDCFINLSLFWHFANRNNFVNPN